MPNLLTIPSELICEIVSYLDPSGTLCLLITCRFLSSLCTPAMLLHAVTPKGNMPALHWAAQRGHLSLVKYLLTRFPVDLPNAIGGTALLCAARACNTPITEYLLLHGAAVNYTNQSWTALGWACRCAHTNEDAAVATVRVLIAHGADVCGEASYRPLRNALACRNPRVARLLLDAGANPDATGHAGEPLIVAAAHPETADIMEMLLDYGADIDATNDNFDFTTALMKAAEGGHLGVVRTLVDRGAKLNLVDDFGFTSFIYACKHEHQDIVEYLAGCEGMDITTSIPGERASVYQAVAYGYDVALRILLQRGASTQGQDDRGMSVFHTAVVSEQENIVRTLLEHGVDTEMEDHDGFTPLMTAIIIENVPIVTILLDHRADRAQGSPDTIGLLTIACLSGSKAMVALLLEKGMDVNMVDKHGLTAMAYAKKSGLSDVVEILAAFGGE